LLMISMPLEAQVESNIMAATIYDKGNEYFKQKDYAKAVIEFEKIVNQYRNTNAYEPALYLAAFNYFRLDNFKNAVSLSAKFVKEFPNSTYLLNVVYLLGESYYKLTKDYEAAYYLIEYYNLSEDSTGRRKALERILETLPNLSISQLEKLHRIFMANPIDEHILFSLAQNEARGNKKKEAERDFGLLLRRFPDTKYTIEAEEYKRFIGLGETTGRVGILLPLSGSFSNYGQKLLDIVKVFQKNKSLSFSLNYFDTKSDPIEATIAAAKLIDDIHVDFIIAPIRVYEAFGVCGLAYGKSVPVILPLTSESRFESIPLVFTSAQSNEAQARVIAEYSIDDLGITKFAILYPEIANYRSIAQVFANEVKKNNGEVVAMIGFDPDSVTLKEELEKINEKTPEAIFLAMDTDKIINTATQVAYYGLEEVRLLGFDTFNDEKVTRLGEKYVDGAVFAAPAPIDSLTLKEFRKEGFQGDDLASKFFQVLWQLKKLKNYDRTTLPDLISNILKGREVFAIYQIKGYDIIRLTEVIREQKE